MKLPRLALEGESLSEMTCTFRDILAAVNDTELPDLGTMVNYLPTNGVCFVKQVKCTKTCQREGIELVWLFDPRRLLILDEIAREGNKEFQLAVASALLLLVA
jgi:hypothetical protein